MENLANKGLLRHCVHELLCFFSEKKLFLIFLLGKLNKEIDNIYIQPIYDFKYYYNTIIENNDCVFDRYVDKYGDIRAITGI